MWLCPSSAGRTHVSTIGSRREDTARTMKTKPDSFEPLLGTIESIRSYNPENGFTIARLLLQDRTLIHINGYLPGIRVGEWLQVHGVWVKHSENAKRSPNGWHLEVKRFSLETPTTGTDLEIYLSSLLDGVTPELAERIVAHCGVDTLQIIEQAPERLDDIKGLTAKRIRQIQASRLEQKKREQLRMLLQRPNLDRALVMQIYAAFNSAKRRTLANNYGSPNQFEQLLSKIYALDLATADSIAQVLGVQPHTPIRVEAGIRDMLKQAHTEGHVFAERAGLIAHVAEAMAVTEKVVKNSITRLQKKGDLIVEADRVYRKATYELEVSLANRIREQVASRKTRMEEFQVNDWAKSFGWLAGGAQIVLTRQQQAAVLMALTNKLSILTGGPGTGKTTTVRALVALLSKKGYTVQLAAPTGRAATRLSEASGVPAQTLHRLLAFRPVRRKKGKGAVTAKEFERGLEHPLAADLIVVDECSMVDLELMNDLMQSLGPSSHVLFVGDPNQLPSIGPGKVLQDLIESHAIPVVALDVPFRQKHSSSIILNAHRIQRGGLPQVAHDAHDFYLVGMNRPEEVAKRVIGLVTTEIPMKFGLASIEDIQVLSPMHHGPAGVAALNQELQAALNPADSRKCEWRHRDRVLRTGDLVIQTRNNYSKGVLNGDRGRIVWMDLKRQCLTVDFDEVRVDYTIGELDELTHAFALTVHKAQGSEYRAVVLVLLGQHRKLLQRNLLYTAITRAKELVVIVGSEDAMSLAIKNNQSAERHSYLADRIARTEEKKKKLSQKRTTRKPGHARRPTGRIAHGGRTVARRLTKSVQLIPACTNTCPCLASSLYKNNYHHAPVRYVWQAAIRDSLGVMRPCPCFARH